MLLHEILSLIILHKILSLINVKEKTVSCEV
jgi:hypothetical protein